MFWLVCLAQPVLLALAYGATATGLSCSAPDTIATLKQLMLRRENVLGLQVIKDPKEIEISAFITRSSRSRRVQCSADIKFTNIWGQSLRARANATYAVELTDDNSSIYVTLDRYVLQPLSN